MKFYFAPMEGLTGYIYRNAHNTYFRSVDKYFSPFISANQKGEFKSKALNDLMPENNKDLVLVPQLLTNNADDFINAAKLIHDIGYDEVNLNLGCPSKTVVTKNKGSGFLAKTKELDNFLEEIFSKAVTKISIKTRIGKDNPEEFYELIEIFNKYPMEELIIHPRIQKDMYKNKPNWSIFKDALAASKNKICYNGDIFNIDCYKRFLDEFPNVGDVMLGRGLLCNPWLVKEIKGQSKKDKNLLKEFHDKLYSDYKKVLYGDITLLHRMKEIWFYLIVLFSDNEKYAKKIKKAVKLNDYDEIVKKLFDEQSIKEDYCVNNLFKV